MIYYKTLWQWEGSVFPTASRMALPVALFSATLTLILQQEYFELPIIPWFGELGLGPGGRIAEDNGAYTSFSSLVGFLVVFRTSQAYARFWDGCTATQMMRAEWFDACSSILAFTRGSKRPAETVRDAQLLFTRLFSLLHAVAFAEVEDSNNLEETGAPNFEILDLQSIDEESLSSLKQCEHKTELVFQWIQNCMVENVHDGVICIPAPIVSRAFQELASGMVHYHDAMKISTIPFPFPYAQTTTLMLVAHSLITPFALSSRVYNPFWAFCLSFTQVFIFWCLNYTSMELQNPFGTDANDIDAAALQRDMNEQLTMIASPYAMKTPHLRKVDSYRCPDPVFDSEGRQIFTSQSEPTLRISQTGDSRRQNVLERQPDPWQEICLTRRSMSHAHLGDIEVQEKPKSKIGGFIRQFSAFSVGGSKEEAAEGPKSHPSPFDHARRRSQQDNASGTGSDRDEYVVQDGSGALSRNGSRQLSGGSGGGLSSQVSFDNDGPNVDGAPPALPSVMVTC